MSCTIFNLIAPPQTGKTTLAASIVRGLPGGIEHIYGVPTQESAHYMRGRWPGIEFTGMKITRENLPRHVRVVVIDDMPGRYSESDLSDIACVLGTHTGPTQLVIVHN